MEKLYLSTDFLDDFCVNEFCISQEILMEHAGIGIANCIKKYTNKNSNVLFVCGCGNNGADGLVAARLLQDWCNVSVLMTDEPKSSMNKIQFERAKKLGISFVDKIINADVYVDAIYGSGLSRELNQKDVSIIENLNSRNGLKIACDIPTGIVNQKTELSVVFNTDITICMGAKKAFLYNDYSKEYAGHIESVNLGIGESMYQSDTNLYLLQKEDLKLPLRDKKNVHKGNFGHTAVFVGEKTGAGILAASTAFCVGSGKVSIISGKNMEIPFHIMQEKMLTSDMNSLVFGMGFGKTLDTQTQNILINFQFPMVCDADIFYDDFILKFLSIKSNIILTPHPKEFASLLGMIKKENIDASYVQKNRINLALEFSNLYDNVLVLKGSNTIIAYKGEAFICDLGSQALAKAGSGDVLAGCIGGLLAQGYNIKEASINGVLMHALASQKITSNNYSLTPNKLMEAMECL